MPTNKNGFGPTEQPADQLIEAKLEGIQDMSLAEQRRDQICEAALELFIKKGFASTTVRDICARSGVNQASIYDYIANKNDILRRLLNKLWFRSGVPNLHEFMEEHPQGSLEECVRLYLSSSWTKKRKGTLLAYRTVPHLQKDDRDAMRSRDQLVIQQMAATFRARAGLAEDDPRAEIISNLIIYLAGFGPLRDWLHQDIDDEIIVNTVAAGITAMVETLSQYQHPPHA